MKTWSIGNRIDVVEEGSETTITISGRTERWKESVLLFWLLAWTVCGMVVGSQLFGEDDKSIFIMYIVYLGFWAYFEYKIGHAMIWRVWGKEVIKLEPKYMWLKRDIRGYGKVSQYFTDNMRQIKLTDLSNKPFAKAYNESFWVVGGERLSFEYLGEEKGFAYQLNESDTRQLLNLLKKKVRR